MFSLAQWGGRSNVFYWYVFQWLVRFTLPTWRSACCQGLGEVWNFPFGGIAYKHQQNTHTDTIQNFRPTILKDTWWKPSPCGFVIFSDGRKFDKWDWQSQSKSASEAPVSSSTLRILSGCFQMKSTSGLLTLLIIKIHVWSGYENTSKQNSDVLYPLQKARWTSCVEPVGSQDFLVFFPCYLHTNLTTVTELLV